MDLSIIILNYKQKGLVKQCLKGIQSLALSFDYEVVVVDNNSKDGCLGLVKEEFGEDPRIKTIQSNKNLGMGAGNNLGIRIARGKHILVMNPDIVIFKNTVEKMLDFMEGNERVGILAPKLLNPDGSVQASCFRFPDFWRPLYRRTFLGKTRWGRERLNHFLMNDWDRQSSQQVDWALGACLLIRKEPLDGIGLFDERFFLFFEDIDLCRRVKNFGLEVWYLAEAQMIHYPHRLSAKRIFSRSVRAHLISQAKYFLKWMRRSH